jgi:hypothetical protein
MALDIVERVEAVVVTSHAKRGVTYTVTCPVTPMFQPVARSKFASIIQKAHWHALTL